MIFTSSSANKFVDTIPSAPSTSYFSEIPV